MRLAFLASLTRADSPISKRETRSNPIEIRRGKKKVAAWIKQNQKAVGQGDIVFFSRAAQWTQWKGSDSYHRFFDSLVEITGCEKEAKFFCSNNDSGDTVKESDHPGFVDLDSLIDCVRKLSSLLLGHRKTPVLNQKAVEFLDEWNRMGFVMGRDEMEMRCHQVILLGEVFETLFSGRPRAVFLNCFYDALGFALAFACRRLGIPCVELQHGQQGDWHSMYTHWSPRVFQDRTFLPDIFWMWGKASEERIAKWFPREEFRILSGGNPWLSLRTDREDKDSSGKKGNGKKTILITLQELELPDFVWECAKSRVDCRWLFRMHPRHQSQMGKFEQECDCRLGNRVEWVVGESSSADLYGLFESIDIHLTGWSTTAYESVHFGVPTVLFHPNGLNAMRNDIESGLFTYADSTAQLNESIDDARLPEVPVLPFETGKERIKDTFELITGFRESLKPDPNEEELIQIES